MTKGLYLRQQKIAIIKENAKRYRKASKKEKGKLLTELCQLLYLGRKYIAPLLRLYSTTIFLNGVKIVAADDEERIHRRGRKKIYTEELIPILVLCGLILW